MTHAPTASKRREQRNRVTISDVSTALGLTKSTVSRALNGYPDISETTRLRVSRMATKMGYRPLSHAQAIRTGRTRSIGFVVLGSDHDSHRPFLADFLAGISSSASAEGWTLTVAAADGEQDTLETMRNLVQDHKADGFILPRSMRNDPRVNLLRDADIPFVLFGRALDDVGCAWFDFLGEDAMHEAVVHMHGLGHRRIAFVNGGTRYVYSLLRQEGFEKGMRACGLTPDHDLMIHDVLTSEQGCQAAQQLMSREEPPTAVVCAIDSAALGFYTYAAEHGITIGKDLSLTGYDGAVEGKMQTPPLSTFAGDIRRSGERLAAILIQRIRGTAIESLRVTERATFFNRGSTGPVIPANDGSIP